MNEPGLPKASPRPAPGDGGVAVGSGNDVSPCLRMHWARLSILSFRASDAVRPPPAGIRLEQAFWADWKAGDCGSIPELELIWMPPPGWGPGS